MADLIEKIKISELPETTTANDASFIPIDNGNITYKISVANYNSGANTTAQSYAQQAVASATSAAASADEVNLVLDEVNNVYNDFEEEKVDLVNDFASIRQSAQAAANSASSAATSATAASASAQSCADIETSVRSSTTLSQSWAVGGTNTRDGEDTNNSKYYAEQSAESATVAEDNATAAAASATNAQTSATSAANSAISANNAKDQAEDAADRAEEIVSSIVDATLSVSGKAADAKVTGDKVAELKNEINNNLDVTNAGWSIGTFNTSTGVEESGTTRIRSWFLKVNPGTKVTVTGAPNCLILYYYDLSRTYLSCETWATSFVVPAEAAYIRILMRKSANNETITSDEISEQAARCSVLLALDADTYYDSDKLTNLYARVSSISNMDLISYNVNEINWERKTLSGDDGSESVSNSRLVSEYISLDGFKEISFSVEDGYKFAIDWFNSENSVVRINNHAEWQTNDVTYTSWLGAIKIRVLVANTANTTVYYGTQKHLTIKYKPIIHAEINNLYKSTGIVTNTFDQSSGSTHSSTLNRVDVDIAPGEIYGVYVSTDNNQSISYQVFAVNDNNTATQVAEAYANQFSEITATEHISKIGIFTTAPTENITVKFYVVAKSKDVYPLFDNISTKENTLWLSSEYNAYSETKVAQYSALFKNGANDIDAFLFFTDPHIFDNPVQETKMKRAIGTIEVAYNHSPARFVLCGGDWLTDSDTEDEACYKLGEIKGIMRSKFGNHYYGIIGNHDTNYQGVSALSQETLNNLWFGDKAYYDFKAKSARFYVFDTGSDVETTMTEYRWTQVDWFAKSLIQNDDSHSVIALHIFSNQYNASSFASDPKIQPLANNVTLVAEAYNAKTSITVNGETYDFSNTSGKVAFMICGHTHYDLITTNNSIPVIVTTTASYKPTFDLVYVDYSNSLLSTVRIGSGSNRTMGIIT